MKIDVHNHVIPRSVIELVVGSEAYGVTIENGMWHGPNIHPFRMVESWSSPEAKLRELDSRELDAAVISIAPRPLYFYELAEQPLVELTRRSNIGMAEYCAGHSDRLKWLAHVPLSFPDRAVDELSHAMSEGAAGVMIAPSAAGKRIDEPQFDPVWSAVDSLKAPVFLHPGYGLMLPQFLDWGLQSVVATPLETTLGLMRLICAGHLDRYQNLKIVAAHAGGYFPILLGRLRHDLHANNRSWPLHDPWDYVGQIMFDALVYDVDAARYIINKAGPENVVIGTEGSFERDPDFAPVDAIRQATGRDERAFELVAGENAARLFGFPSMR